MGKRLAVHLYGHPRTYKQTRDSFFENIINPNKQDGWQVDIFFHFWDVFNVTDNNVWHTKQNVFPTMSNKKLTEFDKQDIIKTYSPASYTIEEDSGLPAGRYKSVKKAMELRLKYEREHNIQYDFF
ncbi:hypothetical protein NCR96_04685 [Helicobacter sp. 14348-15]|uniref:hypothetical protein n=1 Tax=Helicobacter colisuis TaxID=2949739 RepID=UPI00202AEE3E|nr:hypothetical protein [Helicobacter colisuis]MCL9821036.1 hypothetical protein [Helicobacter colisuis]